MLDFPNNPANGEVWVSSPGGRVWKFDGEAWRIVGAGGASIITSPTPPENAPVDALWWDSSIGALFVHFDDGDSLQWVEIPPGLPGPRGEPGPPGEIGGSFPDAPEDGEAYGRQDADWIEVVRQGGPLLLRNGPLGDPRVDWTYGGVSGGWRWRMPVSGNFILSDLTQAAVFLVDTARRVGIGRWGASSTYIATNADVTIGCADTGYGLCLRSLAGAGTTLAINFQNAAGTSVGNITSTMSNTAFNTSSDVRLKHDAHPFEDGREIIDQLPIHQFRWADDSEGIGVMAQEVADIFPQAVTPGRGDPDDDDFMPWGVDYSKFVPLLIQAVQDAFEQIDNLKKEIAALKKARAK